MQAHSRYVSATNFPPLTAVLHAGMDDQLRRLYFDVFGVGLLGPAGQEDSRIKDPEFPRYLPSLKLSQGCGGIRPYGSRFNVLRAMSSATPQMLNSACSRTNSVNPGLFNFHSVWIGGGSFDRDKEKEKNRSGLFLGQRGQCSMAVGLHSEIARAKQAWMDALQAPGENPSRKPHYESPISVDHVAFGVGAKKPQKAICDVAKLLRAKVFGTFSVVSAE